MPLIDVFEKTIKECEEEGRKRGYKPLFTKEEGYRAYDEITSEMSGSKKELARKWTPPTDILILQHCYI
jgi:hypothetical protein